MRAALLALVLSMPVAGHAFDVVLNAQGEFLDAYLVDGSATPRRVVFIDPDPAKPDSLRGRVPRGGRHVNGKLCFFPRGFGHDGESVIADDTYREACVDRDPPLIGRNLRFPDGITVADSSRFKADFTNLPAAPELDPARCGGE